MRTKRAQQTEIRRQLRDILPRVPAFERLDAVRRRRLRDSLVRMTSHAAVGRADVVDFPAFVAELMQGVFEAIVNASIRQMEAYADLLDQVGQSLDQAPKRGGSASSRSRQQLVATMVLMGINRIVVTKGKIVARSVLRRDDDDEDDDQGA
jgi:hypothetical protein